MGVLKSIAFGFLVAFLCALPMAVYYSAKHIAAMYGIDPVTLAVPSAAFTAMGIAGGIIKSVEG